QGEDGIRGSSVTGVQTCALPICGGSAERRAGGAPCGGRARAAARRDRRSLHGGDRGGDAARSQGGAGPRAEGGRGALDPRRRARSEERRVGKGGGWRAEREGGGE